jgi:diaminohydroxyphosphoribosylaminopyrimidine deaminase / 5-amino-6-(5-phosphoribosylamino)uracil reductase
MRKWSQTDVAFMEMALSLAAAQLGRTGSNPAVGCVIVSHGKVIGQGATADGGRPHAEAVALASVNESAQGATVYVTLEPCAHRSAKGPDCASSLVDAGIARLVCCLQDPDPRTNGRGLARLARASVVVESGLLVENGTAQIADFRASLSLDD